MSSFATEFAEGQAGGPLVAGGPFDHPRVAISESDDARVTRPTGNLNPFAPESSS